MHLLPAALAAAIALGAAPALAADPPPRLTSIGCNYDGGPAWLAAGRATAGPEPGVFRVEVPDVDLDRAVAQVAPSNIIAYTPFGRDMASPLIVADTKVARRYVDGVPNGNIITIRFVVAMPHLAPPDFERTGAVAYVLVLNGKVTGCNRSK
jgi:hypothetical protein